MKDNYARKAEFWLPPVCVSGLERYPVVQVVDEITGEVIYTLRIIRNVYQPGVFHQGIYTIHMGEPGTNQIIILSGLEATGMKTQEEILLEF